MQQKCIALTYCKHRWLAFVGALNRKRLLTQTLVCCTERLSDPACVCTWVHIKTLKVTCWNIQHYINVINLKHNTVFMSINSVQFICLAWHLVYSVVCVIAAKEEVANFHIKYVLPSKTRGRGRYLRHLWLYMNVVFLFFCQRWRKWRKHFKLSSRLKLKPKSRQETRTK